MPCNANFASDAAVNALLVDARYEQIGGHDFFRVSYKYLCGIAAFGDSRLVFVDIRSPGTIRNLATNPSIEINVVDQFSRRGYRFKGSGEVVRDASLFEELKNFYSNKWVDVGKGRSEIPIRAFVLVEIHQASLLISPSYDGGASEDELRQEWTQYFATLSARRDSPPRTRS